MASVDKFTAMHGFQVWLVISLRTPKCLQQFPGYVLDRKGGHSESERLQTETRCADMWGKWALWSKIYIAHYSLNSRGYIYIQSDHFSTWHWAFFSISISFWMNFNVTSMNFCMTIVWGCYGWQCRLSDDALLGWHWYCNVGLLYGSHRLAIKEEWH